jgi:hypothetical protein
MFTRTCRRKYRFSKHKESSNLNNKADHRTTKQSIISKDQLPEGRTVRSYFDVEIENDQVSSIKKLRYS